MGVLDALNSASPNRTSETMCLDGATQTLVDAIERDFQAAVDRDKADGTLEDPTPHFEAAVRRREELREQIAKSEVTFHFERVQWFETVALQAAHPPRDGHLADTLRGYNYATYLPALVQASIVSVVDSEGDEVTRENIPEATWVGLFGRPAVEATMDEPEQPAVAGSLNASQVDRLVRAAQFVNEASPQVPRSGLSLLASQDSGETSAPPSPGTSAPAASTVGSRRSPTKSSAGRKPTAKKAAAKKSPSAESPAS